MLDNKTPNDVKNDGNIWYALGLLGHLGFIIALPLVILGLIGRYLDKKFDSSPWLLLAGLFVSMIISGVAVYRKTIQITKQLEDKK